MKWKTSKKKVQGRVTPRPPSLRPPPPTKAFKIELQIMIKSGKKVPVAPQTYYKKSFLNVTSLVTSLVNFFFFAVFTFHFFFVSFFLCCFVFFFFFYNKKLLVNNIESRYSLTDRTRDFFFFKSLFCSARYDKFRDAVI